MNASQFLLSVAIVSSIVWVLRKIIGFFKWRKSMDALGGPATDGFLLGNLKQIGGPRTYPHYVAACVKQFPKLYRSWLGPNLCQVTICHPEPMKVLLTSRLEKGFSYRLFELWIGDKNMLLHPGEGYDAVRKLFSPAIGPQVLPSYYPVYVETALTLCNKWQQQGSATFDISPDLATQALDTILQTSFGLVSNCQLGGLPDYVHSNDELSRLVLDRIFKPYYSNDTIYKLSPEGRAFMHHVDVVKQVGEKCIRDRKELIATQGLPSKTRLDLIDVLLTATNEDGKPAFTDKEILDHANGVIFAGHDTSSTSLTLFFYNMARFPQHQEACYEEICRVMKGSEPTMEELKELDVTLNTFKESMRITPTVPAMGRTTSAELELDGKKVPAGTWVEINLYALHKNPEVWPEPEVFDPSRFSGKTHIDPFAWLPFGAGQRNCPGQHFAMLEMKAVICMVMKRFRFELDPNVPEPEFQSDVVTRSRNGVHLRVTPRA